MRVRTGSESEHPTSDEGRAPACGSFLEHGSTYLGSRYLERNPRWHAEDSAWKGTHVASILKRNGIEPTSVCDVGCGAGGVLAALGAEFPAARLIGYDIAPDAIRLARERHRGMEFRCADALEVAEQFDVVLAIDVFEHVENPLGFLRSLRQLGRRFVFHIPLEINAVAAIRNMHIYHRRTVGHLHFFTKDTALATLADSDYRLVDSCYTNSGTNQVRSYRQGLAWFPRKLLFGFRPDLSVRLLGGASLLVLAE